MAPSPVLYNVSVLLICLLIVVCTPLSSTPISPASSLSPLVTTRLFSVLVFASALLYSPVIFQIPHGSDIM